MLMFGEMFERFLSQVSKFYHLRCCSVLILSGGYEDMTTRLIISIRQLFENRFHFNSVRIFKRLVEIKASIQTNDKFMVVYF